MKNPGWVQPPIPITYPLKKQFLMIENTVIYDSQVNYIEISEKEFLSFKHRPKEEEAIENTPGVFAKAIKEELEYLGVSIEELSKSIYVTPERMKMLLKGKTVFRKEETRDIKKKLNID